MLALRNNNGILRNGDGILVNNEIKSLTIVGVNFFKFQFMSSGPVDISWGDGNNTVYSSAQYSYASPSHTYASTGTWNINITNPQNITALYFNYGSSWNGDKINTNVSWFSQFYNLNRLELINVTFVGEIGIIIESYLTKLTYLSINSYLSNHTLLNVSNCKSFWTRCLYIYIYSTYSGRIIGSLSDIDINLDCTYIYFYTAYVLSGYIDGIMKNGYNYLTTLYIVSFNSLLYTSFNSLDDFIIPSSLTYLQLSRIQNLGIISNFNFKNLTRFGLHECIFTSLDFTSNSSFDTFASNCIGFHLYNDFGIIKINISKFINASYNDSFQLETFTGLGNHSYGDVSYISTKATQLMITNLRNDGALYGNITSSCTAQFLILQNSNVSISIEDLKYLYQYRLRVSDIETLDTLSGTLNNLYIASGTDGWFHTLYNIINLYADITTWTFGPWWNSSPTHCGFNIYNNPHFSGDLSNLTLWSNKSTINLSNCAYTNIPGFVDNFFTNRNTCFKAAGGYTTLSFQGNVDNSSLTGTYQQPNVGTYTGNINDLTETQIDNLSNGLDYTGSGSNTPWTHKEKIWILVNLNNSSSDSSKRYRAIINYQ